MNRVLATSAMALLATATLTAATHPVQAMPLAQPQISAPSQVILVDDDDDDDDDRRYSRRYRGDDDGWPRFRGHSRDDDDDDDD